MKKLALALLLSCSSPSTPKAPPATGLVITLTPEPNGDVSYVLENHGAKDVSIAAGALEAGTLLLEVRDAKGAIVSGGPPPTPDDRLRTIPAGGKTTGKVHVDAPAGEYDVRSRLPDATSNSIHLVLR
jgi:hypothetical protein